MDMQTVDLKSGISSSLYILDLISKNVSNLDEISEKITTFIENTIQKEFFYKTTFEVDNTFKKYLRDIGFIRKFFANFKIETFFEDKNKRYQIIWIFLMGSRHNCFYHLKTYELFLEKALGKFTALDCLRFFNISNLHTKFPLLEKKLTWEVSKTHINPKVKLILEEWKTLCQILTNDFTIMHVYPIIKIINECKNKEDKEFFIQKLIVNKEELKKILYDITTLANLYKINVYTYNDIIDLAYKTVNKKNRTRFKYMIYDEIGYKKFYEIVKDQPVDTDVVTRFMSVTNGVFPTNPSTDEFFLRHEEFGVSEDDVKILIEHFIIPNREALLKITSKNLFEFALGKINPRDTFKILLKSGYLFHQFGYSFQEIKRLYISNIDQIIQRHDIAAFIMNDYNGDTEELDYIQNENNVDLLGVFVLYDCLKNKLEIIKLNIKMGFFKNLFLMISLAKKFLENEIYVKIKLDPQDVPKTEVLTFLSKYAIEIGKYIPELSSTKQNMSLPVEFNDEKIRIGLNLMSKIGNNNIVTYNEDEVTEPYQKKWIHWNNIFAEFVSTQSEENFEKYIDFTQNLFQTEKEIVEHPRFNSINFIFSTISIASIIGDDFCSNILKRYLNFIPIKYISNIKQIQKFNLMIESIQAEKKSVESIKEITSGLKRKLETDDLFQNCSSMLKRIKEGENVSKDDVERILSTILEEYPKKIVSDYLAENPGNLMCCKCCLAVYPSCSFRIFECGHSTCVDCLQKVTSCPDCRGSPKNPKPLIHNSDGSMVHQTLVEELMK